MQQTSVFSQIFSVTMPVFSMVFIGLFLKRIGMMPEGFISGASNLVYKVTMPVLLFFALAKADLSSQIDTQLVYFFLIASSLLVGLCWLAAYLWVEPAQRAVFIQGGFRGNHGILALALSVNLYGEAGLQLASLMAGVAAVFNNAMAVIVFSLLSEQYRPNWQKVLKDLLLNPMIVGVVSGVVVSLLGLKFPVWVTQSGGFLASVTLPLALLCVGATLSIQSLRASGALAIHASLIKLVWAPLIFTTLGWWIGISGSSLGMLFVFLAVPSAAISFVMARVAGADDKLAANIVVMTTFASMFTIIGGLYLLEVLGLTAG